MQVKGEPGTEIARVGTCFSGTGLGSSILSSRALLRGTGCSLGQRSEGLVRIFSFILGCTEQKSRSAGAKHVEPPSCRFVLDKSEEKGAERDHKQGNPVERGKMLSYPIYCYMPISVNVFLAFRDQSNR